MPIEFMKKIMMTGIGLAVKTQAEIEELTKEFIDKARMNEDEGKKFFDDMLKKYENAKVDMEKKIRDGIAEALEKTEFASRKELNALKVEVEELKKTLNR